MTLQAAYTDGLEAALADVIANARRDMALLMAEHRAQMAGVETQLVKAQADVAGLRAMLEQHLDAAVARAVEALPQPEPPDLSGLMTRDGFDGFRDHANTELGQLEFRIRAIEERPEPPAVDLSPFATKDELGEVCAAIPILPEMPEIDLSGFATLADLDAVRADIPEVPEPKDWEPVIRDAVAELTSVTIDGLKLLNDDMKRLAERPGVFPVVRAWTDDGVTYAGQLVRHEGSIWQAQRDTGKAPPHDDWSEVVAKGQDGSTWEWRGLFSPEASYAKGDVVAGDGGSFVAVIDEPGPCPGDGWRGIAQRGKPGRPGDKGDKGDSIKGAPGASIAAFYPDPDRDEAVILLSDGTEIRGDFYPLLEKVAR